MALFIRVILIALLYNAVASQDDASANTSSKPSGGYDLPPPPPSAGGVGGPIGGGPIGGFGFPGLGAGFHKSFDINAGAGFGPFGGGGISPALLGLLGGGGIGGVPPPPLDGGVPPPDAAGIFPGGFGGFGPGYVPSTWIGSALGAKGDLLFPIVIFVFFVVGVWTVIQFLLGFIVPLIASKLALKKGILAAPFLKRDVSNSLFNGASVQSPDLEFITNAVMNSLNEPKCLKYVACHTGNFLYGMSGGGSGPSSKEPHQNTAGGYESILKALSTMTRSETLDLFEKAYTHGSEDCNTYTCENDTSHTPASETNPHSNATVNDIH